MTAILEHDPDYELLQQLKECPDFECIPLPQTWYKKYNLKTVYPESVAESLMSLKETKMVKSYLRL